VSIVIPATFIAVGVLAPLEMKTVPPSLSAFAATLKFTAIGPVATSDTGPPVEPAALALLLSVLFVVMPLLAVLLPEFTSMINPPAAVPEVSIPCVEIFAFVNELPVAAMNEPPRPLAPLPDAVTVLTAMPVTDWIVMLPPEAPDV